MTNVNWKKLNENVLKMSPSEQFNEFYKLSDQLGSDENWLALLSPISNNKQNFKLSISLNEQYNFTDNLKHEILLVFNKVVSLYTSEEINDIKISEEKNGNKFEIYEINNKMLMIFVPINHIEHLKEAIEKVFLEFSSEIIVTDSNYI